jgi:4-hydroxybenzoyl-CoA thioesterase
MTTPLTARILVRWGDCDPAGIAFYPRFFEWMDVVANELHRVVGIKRIARELRRGMPLVDVSAEFLAPAFAEDELDVRATITAMGRTSLSIRHDFVRIADGALLARGKERRVYVLFESNGKLQPTPLTEEMRAALLPHCELEASGKAG